MPCYNTAAAGSNIGIRSSSNQQQKKEFPYGNITLLMVTFIKI
jgi:hypothetical protein